MQGIKFSLIQQTLFDGHLSAVPESFKKLLDYFLYTSKSELERAIVNFPFPIIPYGIGVSMMDGLLLRENRKGVLIGPNDGCAAIGEGVKGTSPN